jgi:small-conductance mechanosensitive channel
VNLDSLFLGNTIQAWVSTLGIALAINLGVGIVKAFIVHRLTTFTGGTRTAVDDCVLEVVRRTKQWLIFLASLYVGSRYLELPDRADLVLRSAAMLGLFIQIGLWLSGVLTFWVERWRARSVTEDAGAATSIAAMNFVGLLVLWTVIVLLVLDNFGVNITALVAGLGVGGVAVALAVQNILGDLFASLSIVVDKPFVIGDVIAVDQFVGTVEYVGLKTTRLRSPTGEQLIFPNGNLLQSRLRNFKRMTDRRNIFTFGVVYRTPPDKLERIPEIVRGIIESQPAARFERAHFKALGQSSLDFEVSYLMTDPDFAKYLETQQAINLGLLRALEAEGIGFAYPTQSVFVESPVRVQLADERHEATRVEGRGSRD